MPSLHLVKRKTGSGTSKSGRSKYLKYLFCGIVFLLFFYPEYPKRLLYPFLFGQKYSDKLTISTAGSYTDDTYADITIKRNNTGYILHPKTKYAITAKVGYVDKYDTFFNKLYRGHSQKDYIDLVPLDLLLVYNNMAAPDTFNMFIFKHEERMGSVLCKGVKYKESAFSFYSSQQQVDESRKNYEKCSPNINSAHYNNYHPIPATEKINKALHTLLKGDIVYLEGYLVDVPQMGLVTGTRTNQHHQYISGGQNPGMCFILYTTKVITNGYIYQ